MKNLSDILNSPISKNLGKSHLALIPSLRILMIQCYFYEQTKREYYLPHVHDTFSEYHSHNSEQKHLHIGSFYKSEKKKMK